MKIIVTHSSPDMDAITSVWLIRRFLPGWEDSIVKFVPAGERLKRDALRSLRQFKNFSNASVPASRYRSPRDTVAFGDSSEKFSHVKAPRAVDPIEKIGDDEIIHVDTGLGPLDHHQTADDNVCGASLTFDYVKRVESSKLEVKSSERWEDKMTAVGRMVKVVVDIDHFKEVFRKEALADYHEFDLASILDGIKLQFPNQDDYYVEFISKCLDAVLHEFENRIWAEKEIKENGKKFETREGIGMGFETINDGVVKLAQKMGYAIVARKDPRKGYVRIKVRPDSKIDLTLACEKLKKIDPDATWYLHISRKMLLNGSVKNPKMRATKLGISEIIKVLEKI